MIYAIVTLMRPSMLLNDIDQPMMEKNADTKPSHPSRTEPVWRLKQKNPSSANRWGIFLITAVWIIYKWTRQYSWHRLLFSWVLSDKNDSRLDDSHILIIRIKLINWEPSQSTYFLITILRLLHFHLKLLPYFESILSQSHFNTHRI